MTDPGTLSGYHDRARVRGRNELVYWLSRVVLQTGGQPYFRFRRQGREHVPKRGPVILASNHRSFIDPFAIGILMRTPVYFVAKKELFRRPITAWWLNALGAFPVERGTGDAEAIATAKQILERGESVVIFPEGTRVRPGPLGHPRRGVGRLAIETSAPVVPIAMIGTEDIRRGWRIRPRRVTLICGPPLRFRRDDRPSPEAAAAATDLIWERITRQWVELGGEAPAPDARADGAQAESERAAGF